MILVHLTGLVPTKRLLVSAKDPVRSSMLVLSRMPLFKPTNKNNYCRLFSISMLVCWDSLKSIWIKLTDSGREGRACMESLPRHCSGSKDRIRTV